MSLARWCTDRLSTQKTNNWNSWNLNVPPNRKNNLQDIKCCHSPPCFVCQRKKSNVSKHTPLKTHHGTWKWTPGRGDFPLETHHFQIPCYFSGGQEKSSPTHLQSPHSFISRMEAAILGIARVEKTVTIRFVSDLSIKKAVKTKCAKMKYIAVHHLFWIVCQSFVPCIICFWLKRFYLFFRSKHEYEWISICHIGLFPVLRRCPLGMIFTISPKTGPSQVTSCVL